MKKPSKLEQADNLWQIADYISRGHTRQETLDYIVDELGISRAGCSTYYHNALKQVLLDDDLLGDYKKSIQQQNFDRLERIIDSTIDGDTGSKKVALQAIDTLNKMTGVYSGNNVTINKNNQGDEQIIISFDR